jgi:hypothetical protein
LHWLDNLIDHGQQLTGQGVQVNLVSEPRAEGLDRLGRVVAAAVKASVDGLLDASAQGRNRAAATRVAPATASFGFPDADKQLPKRQDRASITQAQDRGQACIHHGAVDQPVDVAQPVAQDRQTHRCRKPCHHPNQRNVPAHRGDERQGALDCNGHSTLTT